MDCIQIKKVKEFMAALLMQEEFDEYLLQEAEIVTYNSFRMDGHIQKGFYTADEYEAMEAPRLSEWRKLRPFCFELIKGSKTPVRFRIVLRAKNQLAERLLEESEAGLAPENIDGLYLNIVYENGGLQCVTATSLNIFTMDKTLEKAWDRWAAGLVEKFAG